METNSGFTTETKAQGKPAKTNDQHPSRWHSCEVLQLRREVPNTNESSQAELIEKLLDIGTALSCTENLPELLHLILTKSREITCSDAGSVYLVDRRSDKAQLSSKIIQNDSCAHFTFQEFSIPLNPNSLAGYVALTGETINIPDAYQIPEDVCFQLNRSFDRQTRYRTKSVLVLPMQNQQKEIIGVIQLINRKTAPNIAVTLENAEQVTLPYTEWDERVVKSLASQAAVSIERHHLQESIEHLFEGFVKASVQAIESRDPCTSGHSERVAALSVRLAEATNQIHWGSLSSLYFSDRQLKEIRYAALLHDFGKVGVPEAILTKPKKLYPKQLELIRQRFATVRRTLEMECAQSKFRHLIEHPQHRHESSHSDCHHCQQLQQLDGELLEKLQKLDTYWDALLEANEPKVLGEEPLALLQELSQYTYTDVDGVEKPLLSEKELQQLQVWRGSLTAAERRYMESHVIHTYAFLKKIPWTQDLAGVPQIAYAHHEKLDGSGYPQRLRASDIPIQAQIMTIADIYDALTAGDRPYKRALSTEAAIRILYQEGEAGKINYDFLELFVAQEVFAVLGHERDRNQFT
ncbi:HD family phosphohydrolase [Geitlerinema sp. PCC 9228]|uniref:GAF and HD-GYP domain-containing protein n=1 Tax=Geitlerinema sp. PCC 9228 TaxID=111611 RepID=UPI0009FE4D2C|nr:HD family phosphohydrolase [Geitlerinema sp. PCC 9228]